MSQQDEFDTINEGWENFDEHVIQGDFQPNELRSAKMGFSAGAAAACYLIAKKLMLGESVKDACMEVYKQAQEIDEVIEELNKGNETWRDREKLL